MTLEDFDVFIILPVLLVPFLALFFSLRRFEIGFLNIWFIWLSWVVTVLAVVIAAAILDIETRASFRLPAGVFVTLLLAAEVAISFVATVITTRILLARIRTVVIEEMIGSAKTLPSASRLALVATLVMTMSMVAIIGGLKAAGAIYDYYYPAKYQIYDI